MSTSSRLTLTFRTSATFNTASSSLHTFSAMLLISREFLERIHIFVKLVDLFLLFFRPLSSRFQFLLKLVVVLKAVFSASLAFLSSVSCCLKEVFSSESSLDRCFIDLRRSFSIAWMSERSGWSSSRTSASSALKSVDAMLTRLGSLNSSSVDLLSPRLFLPPVLEGHFKLFSYCC